ncbi:hypothetical protein PRIC2_013705 [Phytophthora ramorum]
MDGGRGFFSSAAPAAGGSTRARPVSAGTRLRQKPSAGGAEDFFASLGVDSQSRTRTGSSASTSSNRSFSSMTTRPVSASGSASSSSAGGWRPPPIGGLGSQRAAPPPMPMVGSLRVARGNSSSLVTSSTTTNVGGLSVGGVASISPEAPPAASPPAPEAPVTASSASSATTSVAAAVVTRSKPTQLFSMEDAEDLYSDDGWDCDSPSTVLSNPADEVESAAPAVVAPAARSDEFAWGDDDDAFTSPVAKPAVPPMQPPPVQTPFEAPTREYSSTTGAAFETKVETTLPPPPTTAFVPSSTFSVNSANTAIETKSFTANQMQEKHSSVEHATELTSTAPPPPAAMPPMSFSTESTQSAFEMKSFPDQALPHEDPSIEASISNHRHQQDEEWNDDWGQREVATTESKTVTESTTITTAGVTTTTAITTTREDTFVTPPVELTSPGAAAGEFWGDGDEDELFDHDDHADEEWDESIKEQTASLHKLELTSGDKTQLERSAPAITGQDASFSLSAPPPVHAAYANETTNKEEESLLVPEEEAVRAFQQVHSEEIESTSKGETSDQSMEVTQAATELESSTLSSPSQSVQASEIGLYSTEASQETKHATSLDAESSPFSNAMGATSAVPDNDPNVFPEAPASVRFLHTPTGTGGPFGRVPSPQGTDGPSFQEGLSSTAAHDVQHAAQSSMTFEGSEKHEQSQASESYMESSVRWDSGSMHPSGHDQMSSEQQVNQHAEGTHRNTRQGQSDEEERDSVVSFSGENSFFPSAGRPSSLYGGSQSSFASHRMYQSSVASTDHEGSSIASFGVSSAGATFGGSERVSEGGAFSDGTMSETPSMVDSSNASTAFGTDFPSVSEGQFSAPGTTIGGSDNASDGGFSDGNASETTSMCESVNTNPRFVSEFSSSTGHYVTETVERRDIQEPFASSPPESDSAVAFGESPPVAAATMFGGDDSSVDADLFGSSPSAFPPSQQTTSVSSSGAPSESTFAHQSDDVVQETGVQSAASLFGATAGADVPNPFSSFGASPATPANAAKPIDEHELPTSDAGDLFGSGPPSGGFDNSFAQPAQQRSYGSASYQAHDQSYNQAGQGGYSHEAAFSSEQSQFASSSPFGRPNAAVSTSSSFEHQSSSNYNSADPFAARSTTHHGYGNSAPSAESVFNAGGGAGGGGYNGNFSADRSASSQFGENASADAMFGGATSTTAAGHFGQQANGPPHNASYGGEQNCNQYPQGSTSVYAGQGSTSVSRATDHFRHQSTTGLDVHAQGSTTTFSGHSYDQSSDVAAAAGTPSGAASGGLGHFSRQSSASSFASGYGGQTRYSSQQAGQRSVPGTPDNYSRQHSAGQTFASPAQPPYGSQSDSRYSSQQFDQRSTPGTPDNYSHHSASEMFGSAGPAQPSYGGQQNAHQQYGQNALRSSGERFGDHIRSSSSASADAFFGRSVTETGASSVGSDFGGERAATSSSGSTYQQAPPRDHAQPSFSRSGSNVSSYSEQHGSQFSARATPIRSSTQSHDLNTSYGSIESTGFSRHASNSSMSRYGNDASFQSQEQHVESTPVVDANAYFGQTQAATTNDTASSFFGGTTSQDSSEVQTSQPQYPNDSSNTGVQTTSQFPSPPQKQQETEREEQQQYSQSEFTHYEYSGEHFGASTAAAPVQGVRASLQTPVEHTNSSSQLYTAPSGSFQQRGSSSFGELPPVPSGVNATGRAVDSHEVSSSFAGENDPNRPQEFDRFAGSGSQGFGGQTSSDFFSGSQMQTAQASAVAASQFGTSGYGQDTQEQQQHQVHESATASLQFAETHSSYQHTSSASYREGGAHATGANSGSYFDSGVPGTGTASPASYSNQQQLQQHHPYQQRQSQQHNATGYGYHAGSATSQLPGTGYNVATQHGPGTVTGHGHNLVSTQQTTHPAAVPAVMTSNKYKDPCVAPPSCLASFGFGGNVVTMFPKRKLRLNIAGSSYRNSPRGAPVPSEFENSNGELRKGPVNVYRMDQLHPKDKEFEQMDIFPGPLTEDVSDEAILEYLDERLKRSETSMTADEAENEDELLLLGVLRVLVKCNGKLRSEPGALNPSDPNSPEAQLIMLLSESSKWRSGNQSPTFPAPRKIQATMHPDLVLKRANDLRELLLVGDRKGAVSAAMSAHMWPEAMLIASFTDKEEYRRVLRTYLDEHYATGDPCRALFMSFADQQENSVQEPKRLLQTNAQQSTDSLILSSWVSHAQVLLANRTADTSKILTELGDRLWNELDAVAAAHVCYLLAGAQVEAPMPSSKMALLGGDHRTPKEARFYVSPAAVQRTEVYEWAQKHSKGAAANLMIPFQGYKLIYAMLLADHGKLETAFKYVTSMLTVIKAVTATMKPGSSMYLEGMKNQLTVLDDRLRQHLGQDRVASVTASTSRGGGRKQSGKWGLGSALSMMGKIVNRVVEGNDSGGAAPAASSATTPGGLYASEATPPAASYPSSPAVTAPTSSPAPSFPQQHVHQTPPTSSRGPSPVLAGSYGHATPPMSQGSAPGSSNGYNRTPVAPPAGPYSRPAVNGIPPSGPLSGNGRLGPQQHHQPSGPFSGNGKPAPSGPYSNSGPATRGHGTVPLMRSQHSIEPPGSNHSTHSNSSFNGMPPAPMNNAPQYPPQQHEQPPSSQTSQHSQYSQHSQDTPAARPMPPAFQRLAPLDGSGDAGSTSSSSQPKTLAAGLAAEVVASLPPTNVDATAMSGPSSDKGKASPKFKSAKKSARSKTPPPSGSSKGSGWLSGLSSFIATKMNPEAKVAKLGEQMEAYYDEKAKRWVFPGETAAEEPSMPSAPPMPGSAPGSIASGAPPAGTNSAPGSMAGGPAPSDDPLAALMAPPPSHMLMKKDPLAAMMAPPSRPGGYGARRGGSTAQRKPPRPQFAVFKPTAAPAPTEQSE